MKTVRLLVMAFASLAGAAQILAAPARFPAKASDQRLPAAAAISINFDDPAVSDLCAPGCSGEIFIHREAPTTGAPPHLIALDLLELKLNGVHTPHPLTIRLREAPAAGTNGGMITGGVNTDFPATSFFDVFLEIDYNGQTLINNQPLRMVGGNGFQDPAHLASFFDIFLCAQPVDLFDKGTAQKVATVAAFWLRATRLGNEAKHGVSIDIRGASTLGKLDYTVCASGRFEQAAVIDIKPETLLGDVTSNPLCDEVFRNLGLGPLPVGARLRFEAIWDRNVRVGDWRGFHKGKFLIFLEVPGAKPKVIASGRLNGTHGVGTHRPPLPVPHAGEECDECSHFEGALTGAVIVAGRYRGKLEATYAGVYLRANVDEPQNCCPSPALPPHGRFVMTLDGVAVTRCLPIEL